MNVYGERRHTMDNLFNSGISLEKMAAFLDGNLPASEMQSISSMIDSDALLKQILSASVRIDHTINSYTESDLQMPSEIMGDDFSLLDIENDDFFSFEGDSFSDNDSLYHQEGSIANEKNFYETEFLNNSKTMAKNYRTYGESGENIYDPIFIKQPDDHSCGLRSQQIVLRDFGIDIPFEELEKYALGAGVYSENGTYTYDIGKVLEMAGVGMHQVQGGTIYDLTSELAQGHRVIVSVDANELWYNDSIQGKLSNWFEDVFGDQGGNHALIVAGVEVNPLNPDDTKVVLTDPGAGHLRIEYPLKQFMDAWKDSNCFMAATDNPAPYQYDAATGMEVPSNFVTEHHHNQFVVDNSYQLSPDRINIPDDYQPVFSGHLAMIGDIPYNEFVSEHLNGAVFEDSSFSHRSDSFGNSLDTDFFDNNLLGTETAGSVGARLIGGTHDSNSFESDNDNHDGFSDSHNLDPETEEW